MRLLFEGGYYSGCGYYSSKYGRYISRSYDKVKHEIAITPQKPPTILCIGVSVSANIRASGKKFLQNEG